MLSEQGITIAPSTYWLYRSRHLGPTPAELEQAYLADALFDLWKANRCLYGRRKLWHAAARAGISIGRDQTQRLMAVCGISGVRRGKRTTITTQRDDRAPRHLDHIQRRWNLPQRPDQWWVADFTYVWTTAGFCYVSFVTDVFSRRILGIAGSIGSVGDALDNALMESTIGLFKTEVIDHERPTWSSWRQVEQATAEWVHWYNNQRLHSSIGHVPPAEYEEHHYALPHSPQHPAAA